MNILVSGASGLIGKALVTALRERGDTVFTLVRENRRLHGTEIFWDPIGFRLEKGALSQMDVVINLAGASVGDGRWTDKRKKILYDSRIRSTRLLASAVLSESRPSHFLCASAIGYYGPKPGGPVEESSPLGTGFLASVCNAWEKELIVLEKQRVTWLRFGVVLSPFGGALAKMSPAFRLGFPAVLGTGDQMMSWIGLSDTVNAILFLIDNRLSGPVNITSPFPVSNREFTEALMSVFRTKKDRLFPNKLVSALYNKKPLVVPEWVLKLALGQMAEETLLADQVVFPKRLETTFVWETPTLDQVLRNI